MGLSVLPISAERIALTMQVNFHLADVFLFHLGSESVHLQILLWFKKELAFSKLSPWNDIHRFQCKQNVARTDWLYFSSMNLKDM